MSFVRANPGAWGVGDKLTSGQINAMDVDHAKSLDKSIAGDTLGGAITVSGSGAILANVGGAVTVNAAGGVLSFVAGGIVPNVAGGISDGGVAAGIKATTSGGISTAVASGISTTVAGGIASGVDGGIRLTGSTSDWVGLPSPRIVSRVFNLQPLGGLIVAGGFSLQGNTGILFAGSATAVSQPFSVPYLLEGATINSISVYFRVSNAHGSVPATLPGMSVIRYSPLTDTTVTLYSGGVRLFPTPGSGAAWYAANAVQALTFVPDQNNGVTRQNNIYAAYITDENGANSIAGNVYLGFNVNMSIPNFGAP